MLWYFVNHTHTHIYKHVGIFGVILFFPFFSSYNKKKKKRKKYIIHHHIEEIEYYTCADILGTGLWIEVEDFLCIHIPKHISFILLFRCILYI